MNKILLFILSLILALISCGSEKNKRENELFCLDGGINSISLYQLNELVSVAINDKNLERQIIDTINSAKYQALSTYNDNNVRGMEVNSLTIAWRNGSNPRIFQLSKDGFLVAGDGSAFFSNNGPEVAVKIYELLKNNKLIKSIKQSDPFREVK